MWYRKEPNRVLAKVSTRNLIFSHHGNPQPTARSQIAVHIQAFGLGSIPIEFENSHKYFGYFLHPLPTSQIWKSKRLWYNFSRPMRCKKTLMCEYWGQSLEKWTFSVFPLRSEIPILLSAAPESICTLQLHHPYDHHTRALPSPERKVHLIEEEHHPLQDKERPNTSLHLTFSSQGATSFQFSQCMLVFCQLEGQLILYQYIYWSASLVSTH